MIRLFRLLVAVACLAAGVVIGALNPQPAVLDLGFTRVASSLGVVVLVALLVGVVAGGLALAASVVWPMRQRLRRAQSTPPPPPPVEGP
jgi:lipopolysaccharide assembly protein A